MTPFERKRMAAGLTQSQLAEKVGVTLRSVTEWEKGRTTPWPRHIPKLAEVFGCSADEVTEMFSPRTPEAAGVIPAPTS